MKNHEDDHKNAKGGARIRDVSDTAEVSRPSAQQPARGTLKDVVVRDLSGPQNKEACLSSLFYLQDA